MTTTKTMSVSAAAFLALLGAVAVAAPLAAQPQAPGQSGATSRYILKDLGTAGGPNSDVQDVTNPMNSKGMVTVIADTPLADPYCFIDCFLVHTAVWQRGTLTDLGALTAGVGSVPNGINDAGVVAGISETGAVDPTFDFPPEFHAVVWKDGRIIDLGTFGGTLSYANAINDRGQVVGFALNGKPDAFITGSSTFDGECGTGDVPSQMRAFVWQEGRGLRALGTLGGPDSCAKYINQRGQITGHSFTSYRPNGTTGIPTYEPFIWTDGKMTGLGSLGGTGGIASGINNRGQITGVSNLAGDQTHHAFLWSQGVMQDLTPAYYHSYPETLNDKGEVVGAVRDPDGTQFAFLWTDGVLINLGICGEALSINAASQVVGHADECAGSGSHAFLWEKNGPAMDLNTLVAPGSGVTLTRATHITDRGEITAQGTLANGDEHAFLLIPRKADGIDSRTGLDGAYLPQGTVLALTPRRELAFGNVPVLPSWREVEVVKSLTLTNTSAKVVAIASIAITSGQRYGTEEFTSTNNCGSSLTGHATCTIKVTFEPFTTGGIAATLKVYDGSGGLYSVHMTGTGT
jgi:probable HAF family extracellular repeat protein